MSIDPTLALTFLNTIILALVGYMGYRLNRVARSELQLEDRIIEVTRRELIKGALGDVLDLKLKPMVDRLDQLNQKIDKLTYDNRGDRDG